MTRTLPLFAGSFPARCRGKEMPLVGIEKALSDLPVDVLPSCRALKFPVSFSAAVIVFCSSVAIIQPQTAFQLGDLCSSRELSIAGNLSNWFLSEIARCGRLLLTDKRFHVDRAGDNFYRGLFPVFSFQRNSNSKTNFTLNAR